MQENADSHSLVAGWSHDIRTHLNILLGAVSMIETGRMRPRQAREYIAMIKRNALAMLALTNHLLQGETSASCGEAKPEYIRIDGLVRKAAESAKPYAAQHGLELLHDVDAPLYARCDPEMLGRVLNNLLSNAIKFTQPEGFVYISARGDEDWAEVAVADTGCGLSEAQQAELAGAADGEGELGIGLKLVKSMMNAMGAGLSVTSRERVGTTFCLRFPAGESGAAAMKDTESAAAVSAT